ncbi:hypothetical protein HanIR_Chr01g0038691 [Helianthus annuus]|nr:hypothetical protein HanIR_Chr01g0038691 [Helianthus annuus]
MTRFKILLKNTEQTIQEDAIKALVEDYSLNQFNYIYCIISYFSLGLVQFTKYVKRVSLIFLFV